MLINRDNYEAIFLMYVDNELSAEQRMVVEEFVKSNEDLREELELLLSTVLPVEDAVFVPKTQLYKNARPVESVQESMLLMLDNELGDENKQQLLKQIRENKEVSEEWSLLQKTVLDKNEHVVFADKQSLYRHSSRVVSIKYWRVAAAILVGLGLFTGITLYNNQSTGNELAVETGSANKTISKPADKIKTQPIVQNIEVQPADDKTVQGQMAVVNTINPSRKVKALNVDNNSLKRTEQIRQDDLFTRNRESILAKQENLIENKIVRPADSKDEIVITESPVKEEINNSLISDTDVGKTAKTFARLAVNDEDPDRFLNIEEDKVTRTKLGGIIRQVKRVVERNTKIKTSNGLRIGGFEIAIK